MSRPTNPFKKYSSSSTLEESWEELFGDADRELLERMTDSSVPLKNNVELSCLGREFAEEQERKESARALFYRAKKFADESLKNESVDISDWQLRTHAWAMTILAQYVPKLHLKSKPWRSALDPYITGIEAPYQNDILEGLVALKDWDGAVTFVWERDGRLESNSGDQTIENLSRDFIDEALHQPNHVALIVSALEGLNGLENNSMMSLYCDAAIRANQIGVNHEDYKREWNSSVQTGNAQESLLAHLQEDLLNFALNKTRPSITTHQRAAEMTPTQDKNEIIQLILNEMVISDDPNPAPFFEELPNRKANGDIAMQVIYRLLFLKQHDAAVQLVENNRQKFDIGGAAAMIRTLADHLIEEGELEAASGLLHRDGGRTGFMWEQIEKIARRAKPGSNEYRQTVSIMQSAYNRRAIHQIGTIQANLIGIVGTLTDLGELPNNPPLTMEMIIEKIEADSDDTYIQNSANRALADYYSTNKQWVKAIAAVDRCGNMKQSAILETIRAMAKAAAEDYQNASA